MTEGAGGCISAKVTSSVSVWKPASSLDWLKEADHTESLKFVYRTKEVFTDI